MCLETFYLLSESVYFKILMCACVCVGRGRGNPAIILPSSSTRTGMRLDEEAD